jgi:hypothetical protein
VRLIALKPGDKLVSVARVISDDADQQGRLPLDASGQGPDSEPPTGETEDEKASPDDKSSGDDDVTTL